MAGRGSGLLGAASKQDQARHPRGDEDGQRVAAAASTAKGPCKAGYDTQTGTLIPPDDSTGDNVPAGSVSIRKPCRGAAIAVFSSEVSAPTAADFIHIDMRATCTGTGNFSSPCTVGQQVFASPGHSFFRIGASSFGVESIQMTWSGLRAGVWRFEVLPGGNNSANLQFRSFSVQVFPGG